MQRTPTQGNPIQRTPVQRRVKLRAGNVVVAVFVSLLTVTLLIGCEQPAGNAGGSGVVAAPIDSSAAVGGPGEEVTINIRNFRFLPGEVRVKQGTRVVFVNEDDVAHNIIQSSAHRIGAQPTSFESPVLRTGQRWSKVFTEPGEFPIICTVDGHQLMGMEGTIIVEPN